NRENVHGNQASISGRRRFTGGQESPSPVRLSQRQVSRLQRLGGWIAPGTEVVLLPRDMDIPRGEAELVKRKRRRILFGAAGIAGVLLVTLGLSRLGPAVPGVERASVLVDTVKRGSMLREVRGPGTLVP